jgi:hypothetical protein
MSDAKAYREVMAADSGLYETCARHTARHTARSLQSAYLCDECTERLVIEAFNSRPPVFHGETVKGYCGLCNKISAVTMRQWFVCGICWNVILAYQKSVAASGKLLQWWHTAIKPLFPNLGIEETEPVRLSAFARARTTKRQSAESLSVLDFLVSDISREPSCPLFHIEQKTGPNSIDEMTEFQLDVNDFNDIVGAIKTSGIPSYIIHVHAISQYLFPTRGTKVLGMWWTDILTLSKNQKRIAGRRNEDKKAIYYDPTAFRPIETFAAELQEAKHRLIAKQLSESPIEYVG